jgi:histidinol-phosphatase (PHP family)
MTDLHLHTKISFDSDEREENYIRSALNRGEKRLGFAEHYDYDVFLEGGDQPLADINKVLSRKSEICGVEVLKGLEIGYSKAAEKRYRELCEENFDYLICSVHTVEDRGDCYFPKFYKGLTKKQAYEKYFNAVYDSICSSLDFQILGHLGYVSRYAKYEDRVIVYNEFSSVIDKILEGVIERGISLEINSSVGDMPCLSLPDRDIIKRFYDLGGRNVTFGSDAHCAKDYMRRADSIKSFLSTLGFTQICYYKNKQLTPEEL